MIENANAGPNINAYGTGIKFCASTSGAGKLSYTPPRRTGRVRCRHNFPCTIFVLSVNSKESVLNPVVKCNDLQSVLLKIHIIYVDKSQ